jgi:AraC-like DNA-binding protein
MSWREAKITGPEVPSAFVPALLRLARDRGDAASVLDVCERLGLDPAVADVDEAKVPIGTLRPLFDAVGARCSEPNVGLRLGAAAPSSRTYAPLELAVRSAGTVGDALGCLATFAPLIFPGLSAESRASDSEAAWQHWPSEPRDVLGRHADEYALAFVLARCREACDVDILSAKSAHFVGARPRDIGPLQRFLRTEDIRFGADRTGFSLPREVTLIPLSGRDDRLHATALELASGALSRHPRERTTSSLVRGALREALGRDTSLQTVARALGMSDRTLQRRLLDEGTTFLDVLDAERESRARERLRDPTLPLAVVADGLGFADLASFSRAFKRWTGEPPGLFRRRALAPRV